MTAAIGRRSVKVSVRRLDHPTKGPEAVRTIEVGKVGKGLCLGARRQAEDEGRTRQCNAKVKQSFGILHRNLSLICSINAK
jgi:hypothetical protein